MIYRSRTRFAFELLACLLLPMADSFGEASMQPNFVIIMVDDI